MKIKYLKDHHQGDLFSLQTKGKLNEYVSNIDIQANKMFDTLIEQYKNAYHINEELKESNEIVWVQEMNNIKNMIEEIMLDEFILD